VYLEICEAIKDLEQDPDVLFFRRLKKSVTTIESRANDIERCKKDPDEFLIEMIGEDMRGLRYEEVIYSDTSVTYVIDDFASDFVIGPSVKGIQIPNTIITLVRRNSDVEKERMTIDHEQRHVLFDVFFGGEAPAIFNAQDVYAIKTRLIKKISEKDQKGLVESEIVALQGLIWRKYLSGIKDEIIANFHGLRQGLISSDFKIYTQILSVLLDKGEDDSNRGTADMSEQNKETHLHSRQFLQSEFDKVGDRFKVECQKFYRDLSDLFFWAEKENLTEDLHSAMLLFDPLDYKKIKQYLVWKIGREKCVTYQAVRRFVRSPFFEDPKTLLSKDENGLENKVIDSINVQKQIDADEILQALILENPADAYSAENIDKISLTELTKIKLTENEKAAFAEGVRKHFFDSDGIHPSLLDKDSPYISEYIDKLQSICLIFEITIDIGELRDTVWEFYVFDKTEEFLERDDEDGLVLFLRSIDIKERPYLSRAIRAVKEILETRSQYNESWEATLEEFRSY
jgi:hypothetical protein